jgi:hypothetical protein
VVGSDFHCSLEAVDDDTINRYRTDFYDPIFKRGETLRITNSARTNSAVLKPLVYTLSFLGAGLLGRKKVVTIVFFDTAGEDLNSLADMAIFNKYIYCSAGLIILLDPLQLPMVRDQLPNDTPLPDMHTETDDIVARTAKLIRTAQGLKVHHRIDIPVAVAFSKLDAIDCLLDESSQLNYAGRHKGELDLEDVLAVHTDIEAYLQSWNCDSLINQMEASFKSYSLFGLSALGCSPDEAQNIRRFRPRRVEDPFLWLLYKHKLIPGYYSNR